MKTLISPESLKCGVVLLLFLTAAPLRGEEKAVCEEFNKPQDILDCILQKDPGLQRADAEVIKKSALEKTAGQRPNPELESRVLFGVGQSENDVFSEVNLYHPFELGGKRGARIQKAKAEKEIALSGKKVLLEEVAIQTVVILHRLRQIRAELGVLNENISTYRHVVTLFKGRPLLSPEQETSLVVFQLATDESRLKKTELVNEEIRFKAFLKKALGFEIPLKPRLLPRPPSPWPKKSLEEKTDIGDWPRIKKAEAELKKARSDSRIARSEAWPIVKLGPSFETESPLGDTRAAVGFAFSTSLPFYQRNPGGKAEAAQGEKAASLNLELAKKEALVEKEKLISQYNLSLKSYRGAKAQVAVEKKHKEIESLFERGLIPSSLMLEAHRQMFDFKQQLHQIELKAIESLWRIYALEGRLFEEKL